MSKAFQRENCLECFSGGTHQILNNGTEVCEGCFRAIKVFSKIDPFKIKLIRPDKPGDWEPTESPLHTGRHSQ